MPVRRHRARASLYPRRRPASRQGRRGASIEHDPEKREAVFGKDHAPRTRRRLTGAKHMPNFSLTWLPQVLLDAGLKVSEVDGWKSRGRGEVGPIKGVMCHHTATPASAPGNMPTLQMLIDGRADLAGPLAQLGLGRDGTFYVIAAGRCNHAGLGDWQGLRAGNTSFIGIEAENSGLPDNPWPAVQIDAYEHGVAALLKKVRANAIMCCGHKEYATPPGRKSDPSFEMKPFRMN